MSWRREVARFSALFRRQKPVDDLEEEIRAHLAMEEQENLESGMAPDEAHYAALHRFGNVTLTQETSREMWGWNSVQTLWQDIRYGARMLAKNPGFTTAAVLTLALGIGANTTIFSVAWRPMRYRDADRLLIVWETRPDGSRSPVSAATYLDWRDQNTAFEQLAAARSGSVALSGTPPVLVSGASMSSNFFDTFCLQPELGRFFLPSEFHPGGDKVAILSHEIWQTHFGGDANIVGKAIRVNGETYAVVGVAPADFEFFDRMDVWTPLALPSVGLDRQARDLLVVGRMKPGVTAAKAQEEMRTLAARVAQESPETNKRWRALAQSFQEALAGPEVRLMMILLVTTVSLVLFMACANVANLLLARASTRRKEIAVRVALGASRWRVMRQLLVETFFFAAVGTALGLLGAYAAVHYLATFPVLQAPGLAPIEINRTVLEFAAALCLAATVLSGLVPAWQTTAANLMEHVKSAGHTTAGDRGQSRVRHGLVMAELALSLVLMVVTGLSVRSFIRLTQVNPGFPSQGLLTAHLSLPAPQYADAGRVRSFYSELLAGVRAIPGVDDAAISTGLPPTSSEAGQPFRVEGRDPASPSASGVANYQVISAGYFHTLGLAVRLGRAFTEGDREGATPVVIINSRLAEMFFPAANPLGRRLLISELVPGRHDPSPPVAREIVGIVNDVKNTRLKEPSNPEVCIPYSQAPWTSEYLLVRSRSESAPLVAAVRNALRAVDADLPLTRVSTMDERLSDSLAGGRVVVVLMAIFALLALLMGSVGLYGVISYAVTQRTPEFALRLALGAPHREIFRLVANGALRLLLIAGAVGVPLSLGVARLLGSMIFGISPYDSLTFATVAFVLLAVVIAASYVPARRATKIDPMVALRYE
jgi:putative ABC transport system permease protein